MTYSGFGAEPRIEDVPPPQPNAPDVVVRVECCQLGGDVLKIMAGNGPVRDADRFIFPHTPGYRAAGVVETVGDEVTKFAPGDRVVINGFVNCGECEYCRRGLDNLCVASGMLGIDSGWPGGQAELVKAPQWAVFALPDGIAFDRATLLPNAALLVHAYGRAGTTPGFTTAIYGCGLVGSGAVGVAKALGASRIVAIDREPAAIDFAGRCGATDLVDSTEQDPVEVIRELTDGEGVDVAVEIVGIQATVQQAILSTRPRGVALLIGALQGLTLEFPDYYSEVIQREIDIKPCFGKTQAAFAKAVELAGDGALDLSPYPLTSHPLAEFDEAVREAKDPSNQALHLTLMQA
ncbi:MAG: zinc-binding dehydrogenase [Actinobacteria bacterium]|nr:zinc-binding dehydrogenase [Actinomycetota bacterium]